MPRLYLTPAELGSTPLGLSPQILNITNQLPSGSIDKLLMQASQRVDTFCQRRIQAPGSTTLSSNANAGDTSISVSSTLTLDNLSENAVQIGNEIVPVVPGGVKVTSYTAPYPGTVTLSAPLQNSYLSGAAVTYLYKEVSEAGSASSSDPYSEALQSQTVQIAIAHMPAASSSLTRVIFLKHYPINTIMQIEHAYSFANEFYTVDAKVDSIVPAEGWVRFNVGTVILREGLMRITYTGGYQDIPDDIKTATSYYLSEQLTWYVNPFGLQQLTMGKRTQRWDTSKAKNALAEQAEDILKKYRRTV